jgi:hypothetical protein
MRISKKSSGAARIVSIAASRHSQLCTEVNNWVLAARAAAWGCRYIGAWRL